MATKGTVSGVIANMVTLVVDGPVAQNEICYISTGGDRLMAEVIKVVGTHVYVQVFESTRGLKVGAEAEFTGHMLEVTLGPGMLSKNYDGLQNDLDKMDGVFLKRGQYTYPLDKGSRWHFVPLVKVGDKVEAAAWLGQVDENFQPLKIMVPFTQKGVCTVKSIVDEGEYSIEDIVAVLTDEEGNDIHVNMIQKWPVKRAMTNYKEKPRPFKLLETGVRVIDTVNPIVEGGTGFIPGPFGTGKTVLQHAISKQAEADIVIIAACGERANEVVEIFTEFPELVDPHTGRKLMERTIIIANTSNMPVAAREASVYTAMTIAEYYRSMGLKVLLMADSTSRWAQALREMSNRMEELPGPDAFPMDLSSIISNFYGRAGYVVLGNGETGSITFIGTVSPAGGNLKEPVTEIILQGTLPPQSSHYSNASADTGKKYIWPVDGGTFWEWGWWDGGYAGHRGVDIGAPYGTDVYAGASGTVIFAGWDNGGLGNAVMILHPDGYTTVYAHNSEIFVSAGQEVNQGDCIAAVGETGLAYGCHCHFEVRYGSERLNPRYYLSGLPDPGYY